MVDDDPEADTEPHRFYPEVGDSAGAVHGIEWADRECDVAPPGTLISFVSFLSLR
jgi:hypothetical protein